MYKKVSISPFSIFSFATRKPGIFPRRPLKILSVFILLHKIEVPRGEGLREDCYRLLVRGELVREELEIRLFGKVHEGIGLQCNLNVYSAVASVCAAVYRLQSNEVHVQREAEGLCPVCARARR